MTFRVLQIDAFAERPFTGNPAGVVPLDGAADPAWMAALANEMNLSETAFVWPEGDHFRLRWFTPAVEVKLCGHATLASAHALWELGLLESAVAARFETLSGRLTCRRTEEGKIEMDFPARPPRPAEPPTGFARALGATIVESHSSAEDFLVRLENASAVVELAPDLGAVASLPVRGVIVTAASEAGSDADFVSRFFAPRAGVPEDPVTGSAHCVLAPYWAARLGRDRLVGHQVSKRGGRVGVELRGDRVLLSGRAVTVFVAELRGRAEAL